MYYLDGVFENNKRVKLTFIYINPEDLRVTLQDYTFRVFDSELDDFEDFSYKDFFNLDLKSFRGYDRESAVLYVIGTNMRSLVSLIADFNIVSFLVALTGVRDWNYNVFFGKLVCRANRFNEWAEYDLLCSENDFNRALLRYKMLTGRD